ncbi:MAG: T9SS type A sorting domain-containing protein, partial [Bacteroidota bacterium]|nr:T9SS type A sorting domain-containing protein [Bacteroidota bacterium]
STGTMAMAKESSIDSKFESKEALKVFPNPLSERFTLEFPTSYEGKTSISLVDQYGKVFDIGQPILKKGGSKMELEISSLHLRPGIYFLRLHSDTRKTENIKLIIR